MPLTRSRSRDPWIWGIGVLALAVRLLYLWDLKDTPFFAHPQMDAGFHHTWAGDLAQGNWWGSEVFFRAPGYPYFLGVLYSLGFGPAAVRVLQFLIGTATVVLSMAFVFPRFGRTAALVTGALLALCGPLIYFEGELLLVVLEAPLFVWTVWAWMRARENPSTGRWLTAGMSLGFASWVRPIGLALLPLVLVDEYRRHNMKGFRTAFVFAAGLLLALSPILVRNYIVGRDLVPVASQGGWNYFLGNHAGADGRAALAEGFRPDWKGGLEDMELEAETRVGRELKPSEISRYWYGRAWEWARTSPGDFWMHQLRKFGYFWDGFEIPNNQDYYFFSGLTRLFKLPLVTFSLIGPLAILGLVLGVMRRNLPTPLFGVPLILMLVVVAFFVCGRFRASLLPLFAILAGIGVAGVWDLMRSGGRRRLWIPLACSLGAAWFVNSDVHGFHSRHSQAESHFRLGVFYGAEGRKEEAQGAYAQAIQANPRFTDAYNNLGTLLAEAGDFAGARRVFEQAYALEPDHVKTRSNLAALAFQEGRRQEALRHAQAVDNQMTYDAVALYNAAVVFGNLGEIDSARRLFQRIVDKRPTHDEARLGLARTYVIQGDRETALAILTERPSELRSPDIQKLIRELEATP